MLDKRKLEFIFKHYGLENQIEKLEEEARELCFELMEMHYNYETIINHDFIEEMADVYVMLSQFMTVPEYKEKILKVANQKIDRQLRRIHKELDKDNEVV